MADFVERGSFDHLWVEARAADDFPRSRAVSASLDVALFVAWRAIAFMGEVSEDEAGPAAEAAQRAALCFAQQMLAKEVGLHARDGADVLTVMVEQCRPG